MSDRPGDIPILPGFYPDPTICRVGDTYYLANSSFEYFPAVPLHESQDLIDWRPLGHVLSSRRQFRRGDGRSSSGIYGGTLRHHAGKFWFVTTNVSDFRSGQVLVTATDPAGPWSEPIHVPGAIGIDPDICWDGDRCLLSWKGLDFETERGILQAELDPHTGVIGQPYEIWSGSGDDMVEGPHLYQIDGFWFLLLAEGGTERGHRISIARSLQPEGPFEPSPANPILTRSGTTAVVQSTGHGDLIHMPDGGWAMVYLGTRPSGSTPGYHTLGRETFLAGVDWVDGWPIVETERFARSSATTTWSDEFATEQLHDRWVVPGGEPEAIVERSDRGITIRGSGPDQGVLCARVRDRHWAAEAIVRDAGQLLLRIDERHHYGLALHDGVAEVVARIGGLESSLGAIGASGEVTLRIASVAPAARPIPLGDAGPDDIVLSIHAGDGWRELSRLDGRYISTEVAGGFTGRMLALAGTPDGSCFVAVHYSPVETAGHASAISVGSEECVA